MSADAFIGVVWKLLAVVGLVFLNGFFVAAEFALVKVRTTQLQPLIANGNRRARMAGKLVNNLDAALSATQLGITLASLGLGWIGEPVFASLLEPVMGWLNIESPEIKHSISFAVGFSVITFLHIVLGELAPKSLAIQRPVQTSVAVSYPMQWFHILSYPAIWALNHASMWMLRRVGIEPASESELRHSEEELRLLFAASRQHETSSIGHEIVLNALDLRRRVAREVMRPRQEIVGFDLDAPIDECMRMAERTRFSRFPLLDKGSPDATHGVIHVKDLYAARNTARRAGDLVPLARRILFVPETARLERLLEFFLQRRGHMAFVIDEYGGTIGLVTLENVIEELVGQIQDEFDEEKPLLVKTSDTTWNLDGALPLHELSELVAEPLVVDDVTTVSGWVIHKLGGFPRPGDIVTVGEFELRVEESDGPRVTRLTATRVAAAPPFPPEAATE